MNHEVHHIIISSPLRVGGWTKPFEKCAQVKLDHDSPVRFGVKIQIQELFHHLLVNHPGRLPWNLESPKKREEGYLIMCKMLIFRSVAF